MSEHPMPDLEELLAEVVTGVRSFAYGPGAGMVLHLRRALISEAREAGRLRERTQCAIGAVRALAATLPADHEAATWAQVALDFLTNDQAALAEGATYQALSPPTPDAGE